MLDPAEQAHGRAGALDEPRRGAAASRPAPPMATTRSGRRAASRAAASMRTSMPLRGTRRLRLTTSAAVVGQPEPGPRRALARSASSGRKRSASTPGGTSDAGQRPAGGPLAPRPAGSHRPRPRGTAPRSTWRRTRLGAGQPAGDGDLGAVQHDGVRCRSRGPTSPSGRAGSSTTRSAPTSSARSSMRRASDGVGSRTDSARPLDPEGLLGVPGRGLGVGGGEHGERGRVEPPPELPEHGLDPAELRREVVGDEQVAHRQRGGQLVPARTWSCSCVEGGSRSSRPRRRAAQTAWPAAAGRRGRGGGASTSTTAASWRSPTLPSTTRALRRT